ncbi:MAG: hypothetical protein E4H36_11025 [Spirochaetales bacterium]|nr:MAG: hypothetical protein E4H36_11025 [Spirochaetales bacterium]
MNISSLENIRGGDGRQVRNVLWTPASASGDKSRGTAVFLPGYQYPPEAPIFFYLQGVFLDQGWSVLSLDYRYNENDVFNRLTDAKKAEYLMSDAEAFFSVVKEFTGKGTVCYTAKSLGTSVLYHMVRNNIDYFSNEQRQCIWLTPAVNHADIVNLLVGNTIRSAYVIGTADSFYRPALIQTLSALSHVRILVQPEAGHVLEKERDIVESIENLEHAVSFLDSFMFG